MTPNALSSSATDPSASDAVAATPSHDRSGRQGALSRDNSPDRAVVRAIELASDYLVRATQPSGRMIYRIHLDPEVDDNGGYNVLRHAGSLYALAQLERRWPNPARRAALKRGSEYLRSQYLAALPTPAGMRALWSEQTARGRREAKLGGAGLALLAFSRLEVLETGATSEQERRELAAFIAFMQKPDGSFYSKFYGDSRGRSDRWTSLYYPGEAAFGLAALFELGGEARWLDRARAALLYLARLRAGRQSVEADHWALLATAAVLRLERAQGTLVAADERRLIEHAAQISNSILAASPDYPPSSALHGCLTRGGRTTPTATRLEGLAAALRVLPDAHPLRAQIRRTLADGVAFLRRAQVQTGPHAGAVPAAIPADEGAASEVRIDYVQHAVSAWIGYLELTAPVAARTSAP